MEMIVVLLFFAAASTICIRIFFAAERLSQKSRQLTNAVIEAQNVAWLIKNGEGDLAQVAQYYSMNQQENENTVFFDRDFNPCIEPEKAFYQMSITQSFQEGMIHSTIEFIDIERNNEIYTLESSVYQKEELK